MGMFVQEEVVTWRIFGDSLWQVFQLGWLSAAQANHFLFSIYFLLTEKGKGVILGVRKSDSNQKKSRTEVKPVEADVDQFGCVGERIHRLQNLVLTSLCFEVVSDDKSCFPGEGELIPGDLTASTKKCF